MTFKLAFTTLALEFLLRSLARHQRLLISAYQRVDFTHSTDEEIVRVARSLDKIVATARPVLDKLQTLGSRTLARWQPTIRELSAQVDHMDSMAGSLHLECDHEASLLLAVAAAEFSNSQTLAAAV
jgi:hypothetical protein